MDQNTNEKQLEGGADQQQPGWGSDVQEGAVEISQGGTCSVKKQSKRGGHSSD